MREGGLRGRGEREKEEIERVEGEGGEKVGERSCVRMNVGKGEGRRRGKGRGERALCL